MARTESKSIQVHPSDEQNQINLMQRFHWNLQNSQEINVKDSHLETRGNDLVSVTESQHYVKLLFTRDLDTPNLDKLKALENEYFSMQLPKKPGFVAPVVVTILALPILSGLGAAMGAVGAVLGFILAIVGGVFWIKKNVDTRNGIQAMAARHAKRRNEILEACDKL
ncbi:MAG: hypothetical protein M1470_04205 [Bacteroidetes bacterium]|nr:hypothetical protein [Bacteroidota bacterium]